jgi:hypothetical protein
MPKAIFNLGGCAAPFLLSSFFLAGITGFPELAAAQDAAPKASGIVNGWFEALENNDLVTAEYGSLVPGDGARDIIINDGEFTVTIPPEVAFDAGTATFRISFNSLELSGLRQDDETIIADSIEIPGAFSISMQFEEPAAPAGEAVDKTDQVPQENAPAESGKKPIATFEATYNDILIEGVSAPRAWPSFQLAEANPLGFARDVIDTTRKLSVKRAFIDTASVNSTTADIGTSSAFYSEMVMIGMADGRISDQSVAEIRVSETSAIPGADGLPQQVEFRAGPIIAHGMDIVPLAALFGAPGEPERTVLLDREEILDIEITADDGSGRIESFNIEDVSIPEPHPLALFALIEREAKGEPVSEEEIGFAAFEALGAFSIGRFEIGGMEIEAEDANASLRRFLLKNLSSQGLGEFSLSDFSIEVKGEGDASFSYAGVSGITFPPLSALQALDTNDEPTPQQVLDALPTIRKILVSTLTANSVSDPFSFSLDLFEQVQGGHIGKIPTRSSIILDGLLVPADAITDPELKTVLQDLGMNEIAVNKSLALSWDPQTKDLRVGDLSIDLRGGGKASFKMTLGQIPETLFTNPESAQIVLASATFKSAELRLKGVDVVSVFLEKEAAKNQISEELLAEGLIDTLRGEMGPLAGTAFSEEFLGALRAFLKAPDELVVVMEPVAPVPMAEILGLAITGPQALPERLGARAFANAE